MSGPIPAGAAAAVAAWLVGVGIALVADPLAATVATVLLCAVAAAGLVVARRRHGLDDDAVTAVIAFAPFHLGLLATGGLDSPMLPLAAVWAVALGWTMAGPRAAAWGAAGVLAAVAATAAIEPVAAGPVAALILAVTAGVALGAVLRRMTLRLRLQQRRLQTIEAEARRGMNATGAGPGERVRQIEDALESVREQTGASRAVIWDVEAEQHRVVPRLVRPGAPARPVNLDGSPLRWVWEERMPLRLEGRAANIGGARPGGGACIVPVRENTLLGLEFEAGRLPGDVAGAADAGRYLGGLLELQQAQTNADAARARFDELLDVLARLASAARAETWGSELAENARILCGATGAAVGTWEHPQGGRVLATAGDDGGPAPGQTIAATGSEMALAVRAAAPIRRDDMRPGAGRLPVGAEGERWFARPRSLAVLPLATSDGTIGVLAVWNADRASLDETGIGIIDTLAPYAALQLRQLAMHDTLRERAERDALTGLPNRGAFDERLTAEIAHYRRYRRPTSLILIDVDHFKSVNDTWGHDAGDGVLRHVASVLAGAVRETDFAARLGGEEFVVLLPETDLDQAVETAERIRVAMESARIDYQGEVIPIRVSAGVSACPALVGSPTDLASSADAALYASKQGGRNRVTVNDPETTG